MSRKNATKRSPNDQKHQIDSQINDKLKDIESNNIKPNENLV